MNTGLTPLFSPSRSNNRVILGEPDHHSGECASSINGQAEFTPNDKENASWTRDKQESTLLSTQSFTPLSNTTDNEFTRAHILHPIQAASTLIDFVSSSISPEKKRERSSDAKRRNNEMQMRFIEDDTSLTQRRNALIVADSDGEMRYLHDCASTSAKKPSTSQLPNATVTGFQKSLKNEITAEVANATESVTDCNAIDNDVSGEPQCSLWEIMTTRSSNSDLEYIASNAVGEIPCLEQFHHDVGIAPSSVATESHVTSIASAAVPETVTKPLVNEETIGSLIKPDTLVDLLIGMKRKPPQSFLTSDQKAANDASKEDKKRPKLINRSATSTRLVTLVAGQEKSSKRTKKDGSSNPKKPKKSAQSLVKIERAKTQDDQKQLEVSQGQRACRSVSY